MSKGALWDAIENRVNIPKLNYFVSQIGDYEAEFTTQKLRTYYIDTGLTMSVYMGRMANS